MDNTETTKPEGKKALIGWLFIIIGVAVVAYMIYAGWKSRVNKQMEKVRSFRHVKEPANVTDN